MKMHLVLLFFMALSIAWSMIATDKLRSVMMPWCLAILLMNMACAAFYAGTLRVGYALSNYFCYMVLCDGFAFGKRGKNPSWMLFMVFWAYMLIACFFGYYSLDGVFYWIKIIFTSFCCGYYVARWAVRSDGALRRISVAFSITGAITLLLYLRHGGMTVMDVEHGTRAGLDAETLGGDIQSNANYTAACMSYLMILLVFAIVRPVKTKKDGLLRWVSAVEFVVAGTMMVRCGSRGAVLGLLPSICFAVLRGGGKRKVSIGVLLAACIAMAISVFFVMRNVDELRAFRFTEGRYDTFDYDTIEDRITTGRVSMWKNNLLAMTPIDYMFGRGFSKRSIAENERSGRQVLTAGNAHSMYMTVFYHAGSIGLLLFFAFMYKCWRSGLKMGLRGRMALVFFGTWALMGVGESAGMTGTFLGVIGGIGCGLLTQGVAMNSEFGERDYYYHPLANY